MNGIDDDKRGDTLMPGLKLGGCNTAAGGHFIQWFVRLMVMGIAMVFLHGCLDLPRDGFPGYSPETSAGLASAVNSLVSRGESQREAGNYDEAVATLERALRLVPSSGNAYLSLARVRLDMNQNNTAIQWAKKALLLLSVDARRKKSDAWKVISVARLRQGDSAGASLAAEKADSYSYFN